MSEEELRPAGTESSADAPLPSPVCLDPVLDHSWYYFFTRQRGGRILLLLLAVSALLVTLGVVAIILR
jgi:hypothetical protein